MRCCLCAGGEAVAADAIFSRLNASPSSSDAVDNFSRAEMHSMLMVMEKENKVIVFLPYSRFLI